MFGLGLSCLLKVQTKSEALFTKLAQTKTGGLAYRTIFGQGEETLWSMDSSSSSMEVCGSAKTLNKEAVVGRCSIDDLYQKIVAPRLERPGSDEKAVCTFIEDSKDYIKEIKDFHTYLDMVKMMVRPGCSPEILKVALTSMSSLFNTLTCVSSTTRPHASL